MDPGEDGTVGVIPEIVRDLFLQDCDAATADAALARLTTPVRRPLRPAAARDRLARQAVDVLRVHRGPRDPRRRATFTRAETSGVSSTSTPGTIPFCSARDARRSARDRKRVSTPCRAAATRRIPWDDPGPGWVPGLSRASRPLASVADHASRAISGSPARPAGDRRRRHLGAAGAARVRARPVRPARSSRHGRRAGRRGLVDRVRGGRARRGRRRLAGGAGGRPDPP